MDKIHILSSFTKFYKNQAKEVIFSMKRYNVEYKNKIACYSPITDRFITKFMDKRDFEYWCISEYEKWDYMFNRNVETKTIEEIVDTLNRRYTKEYALLYLRDADIPYEDAVNLVRGVKDNSINE